MKVNILCLCILLLCWSMISCHKKDFLDEKPNSNVIVPTTLEDFQQLLDNEATLNLTPTLGELSADNLYIMPSTWQVLTKKEKNAYTWTADIYEGEGKVTDWNIPYQQILYANVVLDGLTKITQTTSNQQKWNTMKGSALFIRAYAFYNLVQVFALPYKAETATANLGIPLKLTPNVDEVIVRATLEETYNQILNDLLAAKDLLPDAVTFYLNRPNKPAAYALLARVYLSMGNYEQAGANADNCLKLFNALIDYNTKDPAALRPFERANAETMYQSRFSETNVVKSISTSFVDTLLYSLYAMNDLRRSLFFTPNSTGKMYFKSGYTNTTFGFTGLATDEMYLTRAECRARAGNVVGALSDLNTLLLARYKTGTFTPVTLINADELINKILEERRKEMPLRGVRWTDIRRLNLEKPTITPSRILNGQIYTLPPNSSRYALPIPPDAVLMGGYLQNERE